MFGYGIVLLKLEKGEGMDAKWETTLRAAGIERVVDSKCSAEFKEFRVVHVNLIYELLNSRSFRLILSELLDREASTFGENASIYWECTPVESENSDFRFTVSRAISLENRRIDLVTFERYFHSAMKQKKSVTQFSNLAGDSTLIVPVPNELCTNQCADLASWLRATRTHTELRDELLVEVGEALKDRIAQKQRVYLSTAGDGVSWMHVRLDPAPKYYTNLLYRNM
uniref:Uncharacterized protein n=1 Tax=Timspurckia oligopyrenoides TaxID=708627 RepID=A0A6T6N948_9RHOD